MLPYWAHPRLSPLTLCAPVFHWELLALEPAHCVPQNFSRVSSILHPSFCRPSRAELLLGRSTIYLTGVFACGLSVTPWLLFRINHNGKGELEVWEDILGAIGLGVLRKLLWCSSHTARKMTFGMFHGCIFFLIHLLPLIKKEANDHLAVLDKHSYRLFSLSPGREKVAELISSATSFFSRDEEV